MLKNKAKVFILLFTILTLVATFSFATEPSNTSEDQNITSTEPGDNAKETTENQSSSEDAEVYSDDLYLFGNDVVMDKLVDGNVYIMANTVSVTGQVNGNLFVFAQNFSLNDAYVRNSIFLCAEEATFNGACTDLYAACSSLDVSYDSYIARDSRIGCDKLTFKGLNTRNMFIDASKIDFGSDQQMATIYGNLNYTSSSELSIADGMVSGEVKYNPMELTDAKDSVDFMSILTKIASTLVFSILVYFMIHWLTPKFKEGISNYASIKVIWAFLIGLASIILIPIICILLLFVPIFSGVSIALFTAYALLISISFTVFCLFITKLLMKKATKVPEFVLFVIVTLVLGLLRMAPYISVFVSCIMGITGFGIIIMSLFKGMPKSKTSKVIETTTVENPIDSNEK